MTLPLELFVLPFFAFLCYWPAINGPFLFDDRDAILHNEYVTGGQCRKVARSLWRGLTLWTYALQCIWPKTSRSFHIGNILLHSANGGIFQRIVLALGFDVVTADRGAILYIVLPFAANAVSYITGRAAILSGTFGLLGVWAILAGYPALALIALMWAIYAKEDGVGYAATFAAVMAWSGQWIWLLSLLGVLPYLWTKRDQILSLIRNDGHRNMIRGGLPGNMPQPDHAFTVLVETVLAFPNWIIGLGQSPYHGSGIKIPQIGRMVRSSMLLFVASILFHVVPDFRLPLILLTIGPWMLYVVIPSPDQLIEYRYYGSTAGAALLLTVLLAPANAFVWAGVIGYYASNTAWQSHAWNSGVNFWTAAIYRGRGEKSRAWQELGAEYKNAGKKAEAEVAFRRAIEMNPRLAPAMRNLSWMWVEQGKPAEALAQMKTCVEQCPEHPSAWEEYGYMLEMQHQPGEAEAAYRTAIALGEASPGPFMDIAIPRLGMLLFARQAYDEAAAIFARRVSTIEERWNLGWSLRLAGKIEEAREVMKGMPPEVQMKDNMVMPQQLQQVQA